MNYKTKFKRFLSFAKSPKAFAIYGSIGVIGTAVFTGVATWKSRTLIEQQKKIDPEDLTFDKKMKTCVLIFWHYLFPATSAIWTVACIKKSNMGYVRALKTMYDISKTQASQTSNLANLAAGAIAAEVYKNIDDPPEEYPELKDGYCVFCDELGEPGKLRYFIVKKEEVLTSLLELTREYDEYECVCLNRLYALISKNSGIDYLPPTEHGWDCGWSWDSIYEQGERTIKIDIIKMEGTDYYTFNFITPPMSPLVYEDPDQYSYLPWVTEYRRAVERD